jgi:hypothetical protein
MKMWLSLLNGLRSKIKKQRNEKNIFIRISGDSTNDVIEL